MISARRAAYNALTAVTKDGAYTSLALKEHIPSDMPEDSKRFASLLMRTTLENLIRIDYALDKFIKSGRVHGSVRNVLRLGACQLMFINTKDYAAVSESTNLIKGIKPQLSGFVNGVLRSLADSIDKIEWPSGKNAQALSVAYSYPVWICKKYISDFGYDFTEKLLSYQSSKNTVIRLNILRSNSDDLEKELSKIGVGFEKGVIENTYKVTGISDIENLDMFKKGWFAVQSESSMKAVLSAGIQQGMKLLDCCAAPGGKSAYAAALAGNTLKITAWDVHEHRVEMMKKNFERLGVKNAKPYVHDSGVFVSELKKNFDIVMVDAPCSSMGLMAKSPDIRLSRKPEDIESLSKKQLELLSVCSQYTKSGGTLAYYTCSINKEENEEVTDKFISANNEFEYIKKETLYPHICGSDGFYISVMRRKND